MTTPAALLDRKPATLTRQPVCCACNRPVPADKAVMRIQDATFCEDCWHDLPMSEIEWVAQTVALRGVPLS